MVVARCSCDEEESGEAIGRQIRQVDFALRVFSSFLGTFESKRDVPAQVANDLAQGDSRTPGTARNRCVCGQEGLGATHLQRGTRGCEVGRMVTADGSIQPEFPHATNRFDPVHRNLLRGGEQRQGYRQVKGGSLGGRYGRGEVDGT
jgi:hypothetical protein